MGQQIILKKANFKANAIYREKLQVFNVIFEGGDVMASSSTSLFAQCNSLFLALQGKEVIGVRQLVKKSPSVINSPMYYWDIEVNQDNNLAGITPETKGQTVFKSRKLIFSRTNEEVAELYNNVEDGEIITTFFDEPIVFDGSHILAVNLCGVFAWYGPNGFPDAHGMTSVSNTTTVDNSVITSVYPVNALAMDFIYNDAV